MNEKRVVRVAIIGAPNVGKSSLLNRLIEHKNSIVSPVPHTTRDSIIGVCNYGNIQIIFVDTPGYIRKGSSYWADHFIETTRNTLKNIDLILIMIDATHTHRYGTKEILTKFVTQDNCLVAINKTDLKTKGKLYEPADDIAKMGYKNVIYLISAKTGIGLEDLKLAISEFAQEGEWEFNSNKETALPREIYAAECVREKVFYCMKQEIPFGIKTEPIEWSFDRNWLVRVNIIVAKKSHKPILIGYNKSIGIAARTELEALWGKGSLFTNVIVRDEL